MTASCRNAFHRKQSPFMSVFSVMKGDLSVRRISARSPVSDKGNASEQADQMPCKLCNRNASEFADPIRSFALHGMIAGIPVQSFLHYYFVMFCFSVRNSHVKSQKTPEPQNQAERIANKLGAAVFFLFTKQKTCYLVRKRDRNSFVFG